jgi:exopolysaccharide biosynthesis polyprenyl glycosylphosphotransferase
MIKEKVHTLGIWHAALDIVLTVCAFFIAYWVRRALLPPELKSFLSLGRIGWMLLVIVPVWFVLLSYERAYPSFEQRNVRQVCYRAAKAVMEGLGILFAAMFFVRAYSQSRLFIVFFGLVDMGFLLGARVLTFKLRGYFYARGSNLQRVLVVGSDEKGLEVARLITGQPQWGVGIAGFLKLNGSQKQAEGCEPVLGEFKDLGEILHRSHIDWVIFAVGNEEIELVRSGIAECEEIGVPASYVMADMFPLRIAKMHLDTYSDAAFLTFTTTTGYRSSLIYKGIIDRVVALLGIVVLSPLMVLIAVLIRVSSRGPVLFHQERRGLNGRAFTVHKFRTMTEGAEVPANDIKATNPGQSGVRSKSRFDPRVTKVGRLLRRYSLDELPQLFNVLNGEMSLVGPRPHIRAEVERYERWQRRRLSMKPGLTCTSQASGRNEIDFEKRMAMDLEYIDNWSLTLDAIILLKTIPAVLSGKGAY